VESLQIYEEIARKAPGSAFAAINLGITERRLGNYPQAIEAFQRALQRKPDDAFILTNLGGAQFRNGDATTAIQTLRKAVQADSDSYLAHYLLALALNQSGERDAARREANQALTLKPDYLPAVQLGRELEGGAASPAATPKDLPKNP
jgi:superkiller protein 3